MSRIDLLPTDDNLESGDRLLLTDKTTGATKNILMAQIVDFVLGVGGTRKTPVESQLNLVTNEPTLVEGKRYINTVTGNSNITGTPVVATYIYEVIGGVWFEIVPTENDLVWDKNLNNNIRFNGTIWYNIDIEVIARQDADVALQGNIDAEAATRLANDNTLQGNINVEASLREAFDGVLQYNIDSANSAYQAADIVLQNNINAESVTRAADDITLQSNINAEGVTRGNADVALQANIDAEAATRLANDNILQANIDAKQSKVYLGKYTTEALMVSGNPAPNPDGSFADSYDTANGKYSRFFWNPYTSTFLKQTDEIRLQAVYTLLANADNALAQQDIVLLANISQEIIDREAAIISEASTRSVNDNTLQSNINAESATRLANDNILQSNIDALTSDGSLYRDGNIFRANVSSFEEQFTWHTGNSKTFAISFNPTNLLGIFINGSRLFSDSQYSVTLPNLITIISALADGDVITIQYEHFIN